MKRYQTVLGLAVLSATTFGLGGCETPTTISYDGALPRYEHPAGSSQDWHYQCFFHPGANVYFQPWQQRYYWFEDGTWKTSGTPPHVFTLDARLAKAVKTQGTLPFLQHDTYAAVHPDRRGVEMPAKYVPTPGTHMAIYPNLDDAQWVQVGED
jgi:hypothetical protein